MGKIGDNFHYGAICSSCLCYQMRDPATIFSVPPSFGVLTNNPWPSVSPFASFRDHKRAATAQNQFDKAVLIFVGMMIKNGCFTCINTAMLFLWSIVTLPDHKDVTSFCVRHSYEFFKCFWLLLCKIGPLV